MIAALNLMATACALLAVLGVVQGARIIQALRQSQFEQPARESHLLRCTMIELADPEEIQP